MIRHSPRVLASILALLLSPNLHAQSTNVATAGIAPQSSAASKLDYPDSPSGLEHLIKDIRKAQKENDGAKGEALLTTLILPNPRSWYETTFGRVIANNEGDLYERAQSSVPPTLARDFLNTLTMGLEEFHAERFDKSCDDNAGEDTFGVLHARIQPTPLYELRFFKGDKFMRISAFAFVDGAFRYVIQPKLEGKVFGPLAPREGGSKQTLADGTTTENYPRVAKGGLLQAAKLIQRVQPEYPMIAR